MKKEKEKAELQRQKDDLNDFEWDNSQTQPVYAPVSSKPASSVPSYLEKAKGTEQEQKINKQKFDSFYFGYNDNPAPSTNVPIIGDLLDLNDAFANPVK